MLAVPRAWVDVSCLDDLDAVAAAFRLKHGFRLRIATKYHRLVREFLRENGVADYQLVDSQGATEGTVKNESAEAIADITSTGDTLRANHLKTLDDGLILKSQATLFKSRVAAMEDAIDDADRVEAKARSRLRLRTGRTFSARNVRKCAHEKRRPGAGPPLSSYQRDQKRNVPRA